MAMLRSLPHKRRRGTTLVECAVIYPVLFLFLLGVIVGGMGVFRYQQMAWLSREGARWASVRGTKYTIATGNPPITAEDVYSNTIEPNAVAMDLGDLSYAVTWTPDQDPGGIVSVTVNYNWVPEVFLGGIQLSSTSTLPITW
jgi:Flp pilus assembly protein TadG